VAEDRAGWRQTVCDLCSNESDKANQLNSLTVFTKHLHLGPKKISVLPVAVWRKSKDVGGNIIFVFLIL